MKNLKKYWVKKIFGDTRSGKKIILRIFINYKSNKFWTMFFSNNVEKFIK